MGKLKKSFNRENARRAVNWLQDIYNLNIVSSRNHSTEECKNDVKLIVDYLVDLKKGNDNYKLEDLKIYKQENQDLNKKIGTLENKLKLSEENSKKYSLELEEQIKENENYKRLFSRVQELYQEEHENLLKLSTRKWWQIWK